MRRLVFEMGLPFAKPGGLVLDLGCSRGGAITDLVAELGANNRFVGVEKSPEMAAAARSRFARYSHVEILEADLCSGFPDVSDCQLVLSVLTLQFTPVENRQDILWKAFQCLPPGGALILVEKVLGDGPRLHQVMDRAYRELKSANGYPLKQVEAKRDSLKGVMVPLTAAWNVHCSGRRASPKWTASGAG
ncbi:MAG: methyltransferase domain-containing protein [Acidobacteriota bacterium]